jgi:formylglycine-generating enzyme required for sulfatase activity/uncharacterized caspase-like protein
MGQNWAIVVGINEYDTMRRLKYAERDAESMRDFFRQLKFDQVYFFAKNAPAIVANDGVGISADPTTSRLRSFLRRRLERRPLDAGDTLWFFFAGHGKRKNERDYLMPIDADSGDVAGTGLAVRDLVEQLRGSGAGNVILLIDACRDDDSRDGVGIGLEKQQGVITLFACAPEQQSYEIDELQAGAFTYALLQGLRIQGEGNCATVARLAEHVRVQVPHFTKLYRKGPQSPYLVVEPASKQNLILLPREASPADLMALKYAALQAENQGDRDLARDFWWRVSAISNSSDMEARQAIERLAKNDPITRLDPSNSSGPDAWIGGDSRSTTFVSTPRPSFNRRRMLQWLGWGGAGLTGTVLAGKAWSDGQAQKPTPQPTQQASPIASEMPSPKPSPSDIPKSEPKQTPASSGVKLEDFQFETVQLSDTGKEIKREKLTRKLFNQQIAGDVSLQMVQIPAGKFLMGSRASEAERSDDEGPQYEVTCSAFFMAQTPITQAQWKAVAKLPKVNLDLEEDPSTWKGDRLPVEQVSWWEAQEFCNRLSKLTPRLTYRLPSEAEWEYACRSETTTPFYFGKTITTDVANYRGTDFGNIGGIYTGNYGNGPTGKFRGQTTKVATLPDKLPVANPWGLYDMHGNVWEWCADHWHDSYKDAPIDGSAWFADKKDANRMVRGGSWLNGPAICRSAFRSNFNPVFRGNDVGFRVVCVST